ncbi:DUF4856 domain-containing protein [Chloropicon primus]|nr:DUF4856 domain-containing protein [Chloropicon primus]UPQ98616.1 DUF4856 domain-containing protein [Chloropicon primus]|eukprot:QDZ19407.1 DUF4856 domain-containing protein [Chloropicon primus]
MGTKRRFSATAVAAAILGASLIPNLAFLAYAEKASYSFERDGASTVSFGGQTARLKMADELYDGMNSNESTADALLQQFQEGTGFADPSLDEAGKDGKNVAGKTASGCLNEENAAAKEKLADMIKDFANNVIPAWNTAAADGSPGVLSDNKRTINVNSKGWEVDQTFQKSLIGAFALDQIVNNYIDACKLDSGTKQDDNTNGVTAEGKPYTSMEHAWDEAFGYLYGQEEDATADLSTPSGSGTLLNKYLKKVSAGDVAPGISDDVFKAFVAGRQAIVDGDYAARDAQAKIIKVDLSKVIGAMVVNYLEAYLEEKADTPADAIHSLSEGYGFVFSLPFTNDGDGKPYFTQEEVDGILEKMDNFWTIKEEDVQAVIDQVNERFGFSAPAAEEEEAPASSDDGR